MGLTIWSNEQKAELETLVALGLSASQIGLRLGRTRNAVLGKLHRGGGNLAKPPSLWTRAIKTRTLLLSNQGASNESIAAQLGIPFTATNVAQKLWVMRNRLATKAARQRAYSARHKNAPAATRNTPRPIRLRTEPRVIGVRFENLKRHECHWPLGELYATPQFWCGAAIEPGMPYCSPHCARSYRTPGQDPDAYTPSSVPGRFGL